MHDLVIRNGKLVDGSGAAAYQADIAITAGVITEVGSNLGKAKRDIDAAGLMVCPGWVDIHTHYDGQATWDPWLTPSSNLGATTIVMGNCGVGFAPAKSADQEWLISLMESVEDIPGTALAEGMSWNWESFPQYLDALETQERTIDIATQVPHCAVRSYVMGQRCLDQVTADADDIQAMSELVFQGLKAGALGFSTSRTMIHRTKEGAPLPGTFAGKAEMLGFGEAIQKAGHGVFELASDFTEADASLDWMREVSSQCQIPISMNLVQTDLDPNGWREVLKNIDAANAQGAQLLAQVSARTTGLLMSLAGSVNPFMFHPTLMAMADLPWSEKLAQLRKPEIKAQILSESLPTWVPDFERYVAQSWHKMYLLDEAVDYEPPLEKSIASLAQTRGCAPEAIAYDALLTSEGQGIIYFTLLNYSDHNLDAVYEMMQHPAARMGLSDGGAHYGAICDASIPTFLLTHWARDRSRGPRFSIEQMVHKQTWETAQTYGLLDRGLLKPGYRADINLIDFEALKLNLPQLVHDLPAGAKRFVQSAQGYAKTICAGEIIFEAGEATGVLPGKLIRGPQSAKR